MEWDQLLNHRKPGRFFSKSPTSEYPTNLTEPKSAHPRSLFPSIIPIPTIHAETKPM